MFNVTKLSLALYLIFILPACFDIPEREYYASVFAKEDCSRPYLVNVKGQEYYCAWYSIDAGVDCMDKFKTYRISESEPAPSQPEIYSSIIWSSNLVHIKKISLQCKFFGE